MKRGRSRTARLAALLLALAASAGAVAVQTRTWTESTGELQDGQSEGVAVTSRGRLSLAPHLGRLGGEGPVGGAAYVWAVASDSRGNLYYGTGPDGRIVKITPSGTQSVFFTVAEPMVTALLAMPDGSLLAGTAPEGKIYRVRPDGKGEVWSETAERYVWSLALASNGTIFAGTGDRGIVFRIGTSGHAEPLYDSDESHIMTLTVLPNGGLVAGGAGRGLLYHIDPKGNATVLYDSEMPEVSRVIVEPDGSVVATVLSSPEPEPRPPAVRIQVPQNAPVGSTAETVGELEERNTPALEGIIEGLSSPGETRGGRRVRGRVVRVAPSGSVTEIWRSNTEAPLSLALDAEDRIVFGTGEPGRIYRVGENGEVDLLATLREAQVTGLLRAGTVLLAATSNPASAYSMARTSSDAGVFVSRPFDAQAPARWGTLRWRVEGGGGGAVAFSARSGNSSEPDGTWSSWGPTVADPEGGPVGVPDGRFLQWRARVSGATGTRARVGEVAVTFTPYNRPPALEGFRLDGQEPQASGPVKLRWSLSDPDGDPVAVEVQFRRPGTTEWKTAVRSEPPAGDSDPSDAADAWKDGKATWETSDVPEGAYEVRAFASDQGANAPGEGKEFFSEPSLLVTIDRTAPEIEASRLPDGTVEVVVTDARTPLRRLEVVQEDRALFVVRPVDGVCDAPRETFHLTKAEAGEGGTRKLRAVDSAGNSTTREVPSR